MFLDKEYFDGWMQRLSERLERIEKLCAGDVEQPLSILPDGERLLGIFLADHVLVEAGDDFAGLELNGHRGIP
jgi:hypothetical protein